MLRRARKHLRQRARSLRQLAAPGVVVGQLAVIASIAVAIASLGISACAPFAGRCASDVDCPSSSTCSAGQCVVGATFDDDFAGAPDRDLVDVDRPRPVLDPNDPDDPDDPSALEYARRRTISVPGADPTAGLTRFPLLVDVQDPELRHVDDGGQMQSRLGTDIAFFATDGTPLSFEMERYEPDSGRVVVWVRVLLLGDPFEIAWGRAVPALHYAPRVWDGTYVGVWHLDEDPSFGVVLDSTSLWNDGDAMNLDALDRQPGRIGDGLRFDDDDSCVEIFSDALDREGSVSIEAWGRVDAPLEELGFQRLYHKGNEPDRVLELFVEDGSANLGEVTFRVGYEDTDVYPAEPIPSFAYQQWHHYVGVFDAPAQMLRLYVDGELLYEVDAETDLVPTGYDVTRLGNWSTDGDNPRNFNGVLDEVRVAPRALSPAWIRATAQNAADPQAFVRLE